MNNDADLREFLNGQLAYDHENGGFKFIEPPRPGHLHRTGYRMVSFRGRGYLEHRLVWFFLHGSWPTDEIDHINGNKQDNRIENLRVVNRLQNQHNTLYARNSTGFPGVMKEGKDGKRFTSRIMVAGKKVHLGTFSTPEEASRAYLAAHAERLRTGSVQRPSTNRNTFLDHEQAQTVEACISEAKEIIREATK